MSTTNAAAFAAYNKDMREVRSRIIFAFQKDNEIIFDNNDMLVSWSISQSLTDTINTPFDNCCSGTCTCTVYNRYTGIYNGVDVVDFKVFDPLKNPDADLNLRFIIQVSALQDDNTWTVWKTVGIFYTTALQIDDNRQTASIRGDDILSLVFNKTLPRMPVLREKSYKSFITAFCAEYDLDVSWEGSSDDKLKYAFCKETPKDTIQGLVKSASAVAYVAFTDDNKEVLKIRHFSVFEDQVPYVATDSDNFGQEASLMQLINLSYNKTLQSYNTKTKVVYYVPSASEDTQEYIYTTEDLSDFTYDAKEDYYALNISRAAASNGPILSLSYSSICNQYDDELTNFETNIRKIKATQYNITSRLLNKTKSIEDEYQYTASIYGRYVNCEAQTLPEDTPDTEKQDIAEYITVDFPYVQNSGMAKVRRSALEAWCLCNLQTINAQLRYNPYVELGDSISIDAKVYDIGTFVGILWSQNITYNSGGLQSEAVLVNRDALVPGIDIYDVAGYQNATDSGMSYIYSVGVLSKTTGVWRTSVEDVGNQSGFEFIGKLNKQISDAAIAFDGDWIVGGSGTWTLVTEEEPWVFLVSEGRLYAQHGTSGSSIILAGETANNVLFVAAERGYFPKDYADITTDQGLVVAYITADGVFYRTLVRTSTGKAWVEETQITVDGISAASTTGIQIHRLNDYRLGIVISTPTGNHWLYTDRAYSQMAFKPEHFDLVGTAARNPVHLAMAINTTMPAPTFTWDISKDKTVITAVCDMPIKLYNNVDLSKLFTGDAAMPTIKSVLCTGNVITFTLSTAARSTFTIKQNTTTVDFAVDVTNDTGASGKRCIAGMQHTFEIFIAGYDEETFNMHGVTVTSVGLKCTVRENASRANSETFALHGVTVNSAAITVTSRTVNARSNTEAFNLHGVTVNSAAITVTGTNIKPI